MEFKFHVELKRFGLSLNLKQNEQQIHSENEQ